MKRRSALAALILLGVTAGTAAAGEVSLPPLSVAPNPAAPGQTVTINGAADPCGGPGSGRAVLTSLPPVTNVELGVPQPDPDDPLLDAPGEIPLTWAGVDAMFDVPDVPVREYALWLAACYERDVYYAATDLYLQVLAAPNTAIARATAHASPTDLTSFVVVVLAALIGVLTVIQRGRPHLP